MKYLFLFLLATSVNAIETLPGIYPGLELKKICIGGHAYYRAYSGKGGILAIVLSDLGKPLKCKKLLRVCVKKNFFGSCMRWNY